VYHYVGQYIASPALGSAGILIKKICYGLALPGLAIGAVLFAHVAAKYGERPTLESWIIANRSLRPYPRKIPSFVKEHPCPLRGVVVSHGALCLRTVH